MISRDVEVVDFHPDHWRHLIRGPQRMEPVEAGGHRGWLILVQRHEQIVHATLRGKRLTELMGRQVPDLAGLRERYGARRVICLERHALRRILDRGDRTLRYDQDYLEQVLVLLKAFRSERGRGLRMDPPSPPGPLPPHDMVQFFFDLLWPDDTSVVLYVVDDRYDLIWTSLILRKRKGDVDLATTDLFLGDKGLDPTRWRDDHKRVLRVVEQKIARPHAGLFFSMAAYSRWLDASLGSDAWARIQAGRDLVLDPWPVRLALPVGLLRGLASAAAWLKGNS